MTSVAEWLASLGLSEYAQRFAEQRIDFSNLPDLTDEDLKEELGVVHLGDRRRLLRAIAHLGAAVSAAPPLAPASEPSRRDEGERRQVTVMFADLVGSTALSTRMDPEDLREIMSAYQKCVGEIVRQLGGFVARYMGDGVLVYFGYPHAHEDDAERAVRAGLELITAMGVIKADVPQKVRVGIATGTVVVGHLIPSDASEERGVVGETPNLAARLQSIAEPNTVVIAESTRRLLGGLFEFDDLGERSLKGIAAPVRACAVTQASSVASRFEALHSTGLTALVGREEEFELLRRCWTKATHGKGQIVLLSGEPGIGKSRLTTAFLETLASEQHIRLRYFCSPQHTDSTLYPVIGQMERAAGLTREDTSQAKLDKLDYLVKQTSTSAHDVALFAEMLSLPNDGRYLKVNLTSQQRRQRTMEALVRQVEALAHSSPVLMIFEDAHWSDPTSLEVFDRTVDRLRTRRVLLITTCRPEFQLPWTSRPHVTSLGLNRLSPCEAGAIIDYVAGDKPLPAHIRQDIIERTDGIPLFVEELTKAIVEAESEGQARQAVASVPSAKLSVPATLHASLMARLDRLGSAKELAQIGSAIGRQFSHSLLAAVVRKPGAELQTALDRLIGAGLLLREGEAPHATYLFKHALVRDAAYSTLLREPKRALHASIANTLESEFAEIAENNPELLARHCTEAGQIEKAAALWGKAGLRSAERSALVEAREQLWRALDQLASLTPTPALRREQIRLQVTLITPLLHINGYAAPETKAAVERARLLIEQAEALGEPPEDPLLLFSVLYGFWVANLVAFNGDVMRELAEQFLALADKQQTTGPPMMGHRLMGLSLLHTGNIERGRGHLEEAIKLYDPGQHRPLATRFGQDIGAATLSWKSLACWMLGRPDDALEDSEKALKVAHELGHSATLMYVLNFSAWTEILCGNYRAASAVIYEFGPLKDQTGSPFWGAWGIMQQGCLLALTGKPADAVQTISSGVTAMQSTGTTMWMPLWLSYLARANAEIGQFGDARCAIDQALAVMETGKERWCEAELNRIAGEIALLLPKPDPTEAQSCFERALAVARQQQAKSWELRAAMSMARLWRDQERRVQARELLDPIYHSFTQGLGTLDPKQAKVMLDELAG